MTTPVERASNRLGAKSKVTRAKSEAKAKSTKKSAKRPGKNPSGKEDPEDDRAFRAAVTAQEKLVDRAQAVWDRFKDEAKNAKKIYEEELVKLRHLCGEELPLFNQNGTSDKDEAKGKDGAKADKGKKKGKAKQALFGNPS